MLWVFLCSIRRIEHLNCYRVHTSLKRPSCLLHLCHLDCLGRVDVVERLLLVLVDLLLPSSRFVEQAVPPFIDSLALIQQVGIGSLGGFPCTSMCGYPLFCQRLELSLLTQPNSLLLLGQLAKPILVLILELEPSRAVLRLFKADCVF